jgi:hypothetical protein
MMDKFLVFVICMVLMVVPAKKIIGAEVGPDGATCAVSVTVDSIIEWEGLNFAPIALTKIDNQSDTPEDSKTYTLWTNCNVTLSANNTAVAQLTDTVDVLVTKYKLTIDGDGAAATGATATAIDNSDSDQFIEYDQFLNTDLAITHVNTDGNVEVTLHVQASNQDLDGHKQVADSGNYTATQTITATWGSDD